MPRDGVAPAARGGQSSTSGTDSGQTSITAVNQGSGVRGRHFASMPRAKRGRGRSSRSAGRAAGRLPAQAPAARTAPDCRAGSARPSPARTRMQPGAAQARSCSAGRWRLRCPTRGQSFQRDDTCNLGGQVDTTGGHPSPRRFVPPGRSKPGQPARDPGAPIIPERRRISRRAPSGPLKPLLPRGGGEGHRQSVNVAEQVANGRSGAWRRRGQLVIVYALDDPGQHPGGRFEVEHPASENLWSCS